MDHSIYKDQSLDMVKLTMLFIQKLWIPIVATLCGAILGGAAYMVQYRLANGPMYQTVSKVYLDFAQDETGEVYQYYNGYTWNDLMSTEPILGETMKALPGVDAGVVEASTKAEILSDIRLLTITITNSDEALCKNIKDATEQSLTHLGNTAKEFLGITVIKTEAPKRVYGDYRIKQAILVGAVIALFISLAVVWLLLIFSDCILVPSDIQANLNLPLLGVELKKKDGQENGFAEKMNRDLEEACKRVCPEEKAGISLDVAELIVGKELVDYESLREAAYIFLRVPCGKCTLRQLAYQVNLLRIQGCEKIGIILTDGDAGWFRKYYSWGIKA